MHDTRSKPPVCLIRPPAVETFRFASTSITPPLGLAYVAGALEQAGRTPVVIDAVAAAPETYDRYFRGYLLGLPFDEIAARIPADAAVVGITVVFTHEWPAIVQLIDTIKARRPRATVVLGGEHVTSMSEFCLATSRADILVLSEGEETVVEVVEAVEEGRPLSDVLGIAYREDGDIVVNPRRGRTRDVDEIAWPAWHLFDLQTYHDHRWLGGMFVDRKSVPILATRGCPYQCTYCSAPNMWEPQWIPRTPARVVDEIQYYYETYGARNFPFQDLTAIIRKQWIVDFCQELLDRGLTDITWQMPTGTRSEAIDDEVSDLLKRTGMISMAYAPESGSEETRKLIKKKMKTDRMFESMRSALRADLNVMVFMVIGFPHDTAETIAENLPFIDQIAEVGITDLAVGFYMALPGTQLFDSLYDRGQITLDRTYFRHILSNTALAATSTYCDELSSLQLTMWKLRLLRRFYSQSGRHGDGGHGLLSAARDAVGALRGKGADESKMQTAFRNGMQSALLTARTKFQRGWLPRSQEKAFFQGWDAEFRRIRRRQEELGARQRVTAAPGELWEKNVTKTLKAEHGARRTIPVVATAEPAGRTPAAARA